MYIISFFVCFQNEGESCSEEPAADQPAAQQQRIDQQGSSDGLISLCDSLSIYWCCLTVLLVDLSDASTDFCAGCIKVFCVSGLLAPTMDLVFRSTCCVSLLSLSDVEIEMCVFIQSLERVILLLELLENKLLSSFL